MQVCGQTLVLVDCSDSVSKVNRQIIDATLKYMFANRPENRAYCLTTFGHRVDDQENFIMDSEALCSMVEGLEYGLKDINLTDTLCEVLKRWQESDFACRDIVIFTSGIEDEPRDYTREELFYLIEKSSYPIYIVDLVQDDNSNVRKELSAISTVSGGKLFLTEFEGDDAEVERQISEKIYNSMEEYANTQWLIYEIDDGEKTTDVTDGEGFDAVVSDVIPVEMPNKETECEVIYSEGIVSDNKDFAGYVIFAVILALLLMVIGIFLGYICMVRRRHARNDEEQTVSDVKKELIKQGHCNKEVVSNDGYMGEATQILSEMSEEDNINDTVLLNDLMDKRMQLIDVESCNSPINLFLRSSQILGRKLELCDAVINDESVSKRHCEVGYTEEGYYVRDLNSSNGLYLNGTRVQCVYVNDGDILGIGKRRYRVRLV